MNRARSLSGKLGARSFPGKSLRGGVHVEDRLGVLVGVVDGLEVQGGEGH